MAAVEVILRISYFACACTERSPTAVLKSLPTSMFNVEDGIKSEFDCFLRCFRSRDCQGFKFDDGKICRLGRIDWNLSEKTREIPKEEIYVMKLPEDKNSIKI